MGPKFRLDKITPTSLLLWEQCKSIVSEGVVSESNKPEQLSHECFCKEEGPQNRIMLCISKKELGFALGIKSMQ